MESSATPLLVPQYCVFFPMLHKLELTSLHLVRPSVISHDMSSASTCNYSQ